MSRETREQRDRRTYRERRARAELGMDRIRARLEAERPTRVPQQIDRERAHFGPAEAWWRGALHSGHVSDWSDATGALGHFPLGVLVLDGTEVSMGECGFVRVAVGPEALHVGDHVCLDGIDELVTAAVRDGLGGVTITNEDGQTFHLPGDQTVWRYLVRRAEEPPARAPDQADPFAGIPR